MQDYPPFGRRERREIGVEPRQTHKSGASLWISAIVVIVALIVLLTLWQDNVQNGGAPFLMTSPNQVMLVPD